MRDPFREFYAPTEEEFAKLWKQPTFVIDSSTLLNLYRYPKKEPDVPRGKNRIGCGRNRRAQFPRLPGFRMGREPLPGSVVQDVEWARAKLARCHPAPLMPEHRQAVAAFLPKGVGVCRREHQICMFLISFRSPGKLMPGRDET